MKKGRVSIVAARALALGALVPVAPGDLTAQDVGGAPAALAAEVEAREIAFAKTMADRDFAAFVRFVSGDAVFFAGDAPLRGKEAVAQGWEGFFNGPDAPFSWHPDLVEVLESGDLALSSGPVLDAAGDVVGRFNSIWRKDRDGRWLVVFDKGCP
jgi:ketosteroid isomerase-like protein